jgi:CheY-like chemotaxis protein
VTRILIFEPDPAVRQLLETQVEYLGFEVASEDEHFDIALVETARREGLELARRLRRALPGVPLVIASTRGPNPDTRRLDPHAHLAKPFGLRLLGSALEGAAEMLTPAR